jgi:hypothetical protein
VAQMALDPQQAIIDATNGPRHKDTEEYKTNQINNEIWHHQKFEKQIWEQFVTPKPDFLEDFWQAFSAIPDIWTI